MNDSGNGYLPALKTTLRQTAAAYGYTLTISATTLLLVSTQGTPAGGEVFLFVFGGLVGFAALEGVLELVGATSGEDAKVAFPFAGALNFFAVFIALGAVDGLVHALHTAIVWLLAAALATTLYMLLAAAQVALAERTRGGR